MIKLENTKKSHQNLEKLETTENPLKTYNTHTKN
jgi:hypothetical protein